MAETPQRYCGNCGHELSPEDQFCRNCGTPVHQAATVPTPEADVPVPPPPQAGGTGGATAPQQPAQEGGGGGRSRPLLLGCLGVLALLVVVIIIAAALSGGGGGGGGGEKVAEKPQQKQPAKQPQPQQQEQQQPAQQQGGGQQAGSGGGESVIFRVTGTQGVRFQGSIGTLDSTRSVQGVTPHDYPVKGVDTGPFSTDYVSGNAQKMGPGTQKLTVQVVVDGKVVKQASTMASYGVAQVNWSPSE